MDSLVGNESIEKELAALWADFGTNPDTSPVIRACSMNLVSFVSDPADRESMELRLNDLTIDHPARVFLIVLDERSAELETGVSARCSIPLPGEKQVCSEQITLIAHPAASNRLPSLVSSLLVPDVPVVLWIERSGPLPLFGQMSAMSDLIILDSAGDQDFTLTRQFQKQDSPVRIRDLAWERTEFWRRLTSLLFENPDLLNDLKNLETVVVTWGNSAGGISGENSALLFGGWMTHSIRTMADQPRREVRIRLTGTPEQITPSGIVSVEFVFGDSSSYRLTGRPEGECPVVTHLAEGRVVSEQIIPIHDVSEEQRISILLTLHERGPGYSEALQTLSARK